MAHAGPQEKTREEGTCDSFSLLSQIGRPRGHSPGQRKGPPLSWRSARATRDTSTPHCRAGRGRKGGKLQESPRPPLGQLGPQLTPQNLNPRQTGQSSRFRVSLQTRGWGGVGAASKQNEHRASAAGLGPPYSPLPLPVPQKGGARDPEAWGSPCPRWRALPPSARQPGRKTGRVLASKTKVAPVPQKSTRWYYWNKQQIKIRAAPYTSQTYSSKENDCLTVELSRRSTCPGLAHKTAKLTRLC